MKTQERGSGDLPIANITIFGSVFAVHSELRRDLRGLVHRPYSCWVH